jgi:hypothetical protein
LSADVLQAIQATLDSSSKANAADQLQDQAAQLQYLRECLNFAMQERDQLLLLNRSMTAMLVQHVRLVAAAAGAAGAGAAAEGADGAPAAAAAAKHSDGAQAVKGGAAVCGSKACKRAARLRRCLSYEV